MSVYSTFDDKDLSPTLYCTAFQDPFDALLFTSTRVVVIAHGGTVHGIQASGGAALGPYSFSSSTQGQPSGARSNAFDVTVASAAVDG